MTALRDILGEIDSWLGAAAYFPFVLLGVGLFFTLYLGFPQLRYFKRAWGVLFGRHTREDAEGDTSHFQALSTALSGTVGTGNIAGVAFAIFLGGPAALFWMWMTAFLGMTTKFVEVTLSHKYRVKDDKGEMAGRPHVLHGARPEHEVAGGDLRRRHGAEHARLRQHAAEREPGERPQRLLRHSAVGRAGRRSRCCSSW